METTPATGRPKSSRRQKARGGCADDSPEGGNNKHRAWDVGICEKQDPEREDRCRTWQAKCRHSWIAVPQREVQEGIHDQSVSDNYAPGDAAATSTSCEYKVGPEYAEPEDECRQKQKGCREDRCDRVDHAKKCQVIDDCAPQPQCCEDRRCPPAAPTSAASGKSDHQHTEGVENDLRGPDCQIVPPEDGEELLGTEWNRHRLPPCLPAIPMLPKRAARSKMPPRRRGHRSGRSATHPGVRGHLSLWP